MAEFLYATRIEIFLSQLFVQKIGADVKNMRNHVNNDGNQ